MIKIIDLLGRKTREKINLYNRLIVEKRISLKQIKTPQLSGFYFSGPLGPYFELF